MSQDVTGDFTPPDEWDTVRVAMGTVRYRWRTGTWVREDSADGSRRMMLGEEHELLDHIRALRAESRRLWDDLKARDSQVTMLEFERDVAQHNVEALTERIEELSPGYKAQLQAGLQKAERIGRELDEAIKDGRFPPDGWEIVR